MTEGINKIEKTYRRLVAEGREIIRLFSGNPNDEGFIFPPEILEEGYHRYFQNQEYHPHPKGDPAARQAISTYYQERGLEVDPENILLTAGTSESFFYLFSLIAQAGDNVLTPNPAYPLFDHIASLAKIQLRHYQLDEDRNWSIDLEDLKKKTNDRTKAIVLISPNNPTGAVPSVDEIKAVVDWANKKNLSLICDEVFSEFYFGKGSFPRPAVVAKPKLCFTLNGISKMFALPALKLGWVAVTGDPSLVNSAVDQLETPTDTFLSCHTPIQKILPDLFSKGRDFVVAYRNEVGRRRELAITLLREIPQIQFIDPIGGFYLMARVLPNDLAHHLEEEFVIRLMDETGIFVHPGYFFDYERGIHLVISYLMVPEKLRKGLEVLGRFLEQR